VRQSSKTHSSKPPSCTQEDLLSLDASRGASFQRRPPDLARLVSEHKLLQVTKSQDALGPHLEDARRIADPAATLKSSKSRPFLKKAIVVERKLQIDLGENPLTVDQSFNTPTASTTFKRQSQAAAEARKAPLAPIAADASLFRPQGLRKAPSLSSDPEDQQAPSKKHQKLKIITGSSHGRRDAKASTIYKITTSSFNKTSKSSLQSVSKDPQSSSLARVDRSLTSLGLKDQADRQQPTPFSRKLTHLELDRTPKKKPVRSTDPYLFDSASKQPSRFLSSIKRVHLSESQKDCGRPLFGPFGPASATYYKERINEHHTREVERKIADRRIRILQSSLAQLERDSDRLARDEPLDSAEKNPQV